MRDFRDVEENALRVYELALTHDFPGPLRPAVERHRLAIQETLLELRGAELLGKAS